jgi:hypothetical protein
MDTDRKAQKDEILAGMRANGANSLELAGQLPSILVELTERQCGLLLDLFLTHHQAVKEKAPLEQFFRCLVVLVERERTRRNLVEDFEVVELENLLDR